MNVFVLGPMSSGKTVLAACMYEHIILNREGERGKFDSVQFGEERETDRDLSDIVTSLLEGEKWPSSTRRSGAYFYQFSLDRGWLSPAITAEIVDYAGEYFRGIPDGIKKYDNLTEEVLNSLENYGLIKEIEGIYQRIKSKTMSFSDIKKIDDIAGKDSFDHHEMRNLILLYLINRIIQANKLIFLLDGDKVKNLIENWNQEINTDCGVYADIMQILGEDREYAIVITKADVMDDQFNSRRNKSTNEWLKSVLKELENNFAFRELTNKTSLYCFGTCLETSEVNGVKKPFPSRTLPVWGYSDLADWIAHEGYWNI